MSIARMQISDKWRSRVSDLSDTEFAWEGNTQNQEVTPGTYIYLIELITGSGDNLIKSGEVVES